ncbi:MAG: pentapeptide repeat-containing protein [Gammaproteobacteria bacterium]
MAYQRLLKRGQLLDVIVEGDVDLNALQIPDGAQQAFDAYQIRNVTFSGPVELKNGAVNVNFKIERSRFLQTLHLQQATLNAFTLKDSAVGGNLVIENCRFNGVAWFERDQFNADVNIHFSKFLKRTSFRDTLFAGRAEFLASEFGKTALPTQSTSFSNTVFKGPAIFNHTVFNTPAKFQSALFESDAAFLSTRMPVGGLFRNVHFKGDAEFRFCRMGEAHFGDENNITLFAARADFRGCHFESAEFAYAEFLGKTSFVETRFDAGGANFRYANFEGSVDFADIYAKGPLYFQNSYFPALHGYWRDFKQALLESKPDTKLLTSFRDRFEASGDKNGALDLSYYLSKHAFTETISQPLPALVENPSEFIDVFSQHAIAYLEWLVWGCPTGYGTKLGRILLITIGSWLLVAFTLIPAKRLLVKTKLTDHSDTRTALYQPVASNDLPRGYLIPDTLLMRCIFSLNFAFGLLFKVGAKDLRFVAFANIPRRYQFWQRYFFLLWWFGYGLLLLMSLTFANVSPLLKNLIGELIV